MTRFVVVLEQYPSTQTHWKVAYRAETLEDAEAATSWSGWVGMWPKARWSCEHIGERKTGLLNGRTGIVDEPSTIYRLTLVSGGVG